MQSKTKFLEEETEIQPEIQQSIEIPAGHVLLEGKDGVFFIAQRTYDKWYKERHEYKLLATSAQTNTYLLTNQTKTTYENLTRTSSKITIRTSGGCGNCGK